MSPRDRVALVTVAAGVALLTVGLVLMFGPFALVACGAIIAGAGFLLATEREVLDDTPAVVPPAEGIDREQPFRIVKPAAFEPPPELVDAPFTVAKPPGMQPAPDVEVG